ncbi:MAG: Neelaredoxin [Candidatus Eisenbacteria bacterium]|nr:Neelaredoxin [Candidatus Eisenbacteria bacterium]
MENIGTLFQTDDWKNEKHVPVIDCNEPFTKGTPTPVTVTVGKEVDHPNTTAHHIRWIRLFFQPKDEKFPYEIANCEFSAHGASTDGPDSSTVYTHHGVTVLMKTDKPGTLIAMSFCNIHGLWQSTRDVGVE